MTEVVPREDGKNDLPVAIEAARKHVDKAIPRE